jgi:hypothetical protein
MDERDQILKAAAEAAKSQMGAVPQQAVVQPQPVPMSIQLSTMQDINGTKFVVMNVLTPLGQTVLFFDPNGAETVAENLKQTARLARTGLEIAGGLG